MLRNSFGVRDLKTTDLSANYELSRLAASLAAINESAMARPAAMEAMDCLDAYYYKVGNHLTGRAWKRSR